MYSSLSDWLPLFYHMNENYTRTGTADRTAVPVNRFMRTALRGGFLLFCLEQAFDLAGVVDVDLLGGGDLGQTGHGHDSAGLAHHEACAGGQTGRAHGNIKAGGTAQSLLVVGQGVLGLSHTDRQVAVTHLCDLLQLLGGSGQNGNAVGAVDLGGDGADLLLQSHIIRPNQRTAAMTFSGKAKNDTGKSPIRN